MLFSTLIPITLLAASVAAYPASDSSGQHLPSVPAPVTATPTSKVCQRTCFAGPTECQAGWVCQFAFIWKYTCQNEHGLTKENRSVSRLVDAGRAAKPKPMVIAARILIPCPRPFPMSHLRPKSVKRCALASQLSVRPDGLVNRLVDAGRAVKPMAARTRIQCPHLCPMSQLRRTRFARGCAMMVRVSARLDGSVSKLV